MKDQEDILEGIEIIRFDNSETPAYEKRLLSLGLCFQYAKKLINSEGQDNFNISFNLLEAANYTAFYNQINEISEIKDLDNFISFFVNNSSLYSVSNDKSNFILEKCYENNSRLKGYRIFSPEVGIYDFTKDDLSDNLSDFLYIMKEVIKPTHCFDIKKQIFREFSDAILQKRIERSGCIAFIYFGINENLEEFLSNKVNLKTRTFLSDSLQVLAARMKNIEALNILMDKTEVIYSKKDFNDWIEAKEILSSAGLNIFTQKIDTFLEEKTFRTNFCEILGKDLSFSEGDCSVVRRYDKYYNKVTTNLIKPNDIDDIIFDSTLDIDLLCHGTNSDFKHSSSIFHKDDFTFRFFQAIEKNIGKNTVNINLYSCHAGSAIEDVGCLPVGSTLATYGDECRTIFEHNVLYVAKHKRDIPQIRNPFVSFAFHICNFSERSKLAVVTKSGNYKIENSFLDLYTNEFSDEQIKNWQKLRIKELKQFVNRNYKKFTPNLQHAADNFNEFFKEDLSLTNFIDAQNIRRFRKYTGNPLYYAIIEENVPRITRILKSPSGCSLNEKIISELFPLDIEVDNKNICKILIENGADPNKSHYNILIREIISSKPDVELIGLYLAEGFDPDKADKNSITPLMYAEQRNLHKVSELLINNGASISLMDSEGKNAFDYAKDKVGFIKMVLNSAQAENTIEDLLEVALDECKSLKDNNNFKEIYPIIQAFPRTLQPTFRGVIEEVAAMGNFAAREVLRSPEQSELRKRKFTDYVGSDSNPEKDARNRKIF